MNIMERDLNFGLTPDEYHQLGFESDTSFTDDGGILSILPVKYTQSEVREIYRKAQLSGFFKAKCYYEERAKKFILMESKKNTLEENEFARALTDLCEKHGFGLRSIHGHGLVGVRRLPNRPI